MRPLRCPFQKMRLEHAKLLKKLLRQVATKKETSSPFDQVSERHHPLLSDEKLNLAAGIVRVVNQGFVSHRLKVRNDS